METALKTLGGKTALKLKRGETLHDVIERGLSYAAFENLAETLGLSRAEQTRVLGVSPRTADRWRKSRHLNANASDRVARLARLYALAVDGIGHKARASRWMRDAIPGLGNRRPLDLAMTDWGAQRVSEELLRIKHGVYH